MHGFTSCIRWIGSILIVYIHAYVNVILIVTHLRKFVSAFQSTYYYPMYITFWHQTCKRMVPTLICELKCPPSEKFLSETCAVDNLYIMYTYNVLYTYVCLTSYCSQFCLMWLMIFKKMSLHSWLTSQTISLIWNRYAYLVYKHIYVHILRFKQIFKYSDWYIHICLPLVHFSDTKIGNHNYLFAVCSGIYWALVI